MESELICSEESIGVETELIAEVGYTGLHAFTLKRIGVACPHAMRPSRPPPCSV